jgi:phage terminase Nu1 subunit (DNA packaging protein)
MRAIARGRLQKALTADGRIADPDLADAEWAANTDLSKAPGEVKARAAAAVQPADQGDQADPIEDEGDSQGAAAIAGASAREKHWKAKLAELQYRQRAGELVNAAEMADRMATDYATVRTKLLGLPSKAKQRLPHLTLADLATLEEIVREDLEELAG